MSESSTTTHYRACHLCEAICGLKITVTDGRVSDIRGDPEDPLSHGYVCPKATALADLQEDPDRLCRPLRREGRQWREIGWDEAIEQAVRELRGIGEKYGANAVGIYRGNPCVHNWGLMTHPNHYLRRLGTRNNFSATSADQLPHHLVCMWMYGHQLLQPIPDIDRTDFLLLLGYNPMASNGSIMTVPDIRGRLKALRARGGRLVVIDPRRTETAAVADRHHFVRPGTDAALLLAMLHTIFEQDLLRETHLPLGAGQLKRIAELVAPFSAEYAAGYTGIAADAIRRLAIEFASAPSAACHGRMGLSTQRFGTLCQWAIQILQLVTGNLDSEGGTLLSAAAVAQPGRGDRQPGSFGRRHSRVSAYPEFSGEFPVAAMAEEMLTPGEGQIRAMVTVAGNPVLSTPNGRQLDRALAGLDFMLSFDIYLNETTRHAHLILPPTSPLEHDHYDIAFHRFAVRNTARYNPPVLPRPEGALHDWEIFVALAEADARLNGEMPPTIPEPTTMLDRWLRSGPYGRDAGHPLALDLQTLAAHPHGIDLGPLAPSLGDRLCHEDGHIDCLPEAIPGEIDRLARELAEARGTEQLLLFGRRHIRSNNSWMHNSRRLVKGPRRDRMLMNPSDMHCRGLSDGQAVSVRSRVGSLRIEVEASEEIMAGTVSIPHGWGHDREGVRLGVAEMHPGASLNDITDERFIDPASGTAVLNGLPVEVEA